MMHEQNIHDNNVYAYSVFSDVRRIRLYTEFRDVTPIEYTDVIFSGVVAHHFECSLNGNILYSIKEQDPRSLLDEYSWLFDRLKNYGWPVMDRYDALPDLCQRLREKGVLAYRIDSSLGLTGFVLCSSVEYITRNARAYVDEGSNP